MKTIIVLFLWAQGEPAPFLAFTDSEACWAYAADITLELGFSSECRIARLDTAIGTAPLAPETSIRPKARPM